jgi:hypothetical protein
VPGGYVDAERVTPPGGHAWCVGVLPNESVVQLLTKVGIVRFLFGCCLLLCGSALGYYLGRPADDRALSDRETADPFAYFAGRPIDAAEAWRAYFESRRQARTFVGDPKPHPFLVAAAFALLGTAVLGVGAAAQQTAAAGTRD